MKAVIDKRHPLDGTVEAMTMLKVDKKKENILITI
jgi:hypothetical protein